MVAGKNTKHFDIIEKITIQKLTSSLDDFAFHIVGQIKLASSSDNLEFNGFKEKSEKGNNTKSQNVIRSYKIRCDDKLKKTLNQNVKVIEQNEAKSQTNNNSVLDTEIVLTNEKYKNKYDVYQLKSTLKFPNGEKVSMTRTVYDDESQTAEESSSNSNDSELPKFWIEAKNADDDEDKFKWRKSRTIEGVQYIQFEPGEDYRIVVQNDTENKFGMKILIDGRSVLLPSQNQIDMPMNQTDVAMDENNTEYAIRGNSTQTKMSVVDSIPNNESTETSDSDENANASTETSDSNENENASTETSDSNENANASTETSDSDENANESTETSDSDENANESTETSDSDENANESAEYSDSPSEDEDDRGPSVWLEEAKPLVSIPHTIFRLPGFIHPEDSTATDTKRRSNGFKAESIASIMESPDYNEANAAHYGLITVAFYNEQDEQSGIRSGNGAPPSDIATVFGTERDIDIRKEPISLENVPCAIFYIRCASKSVIDAYKNDPDYLANQSDDDTDTDTAIRSATVKSTNTRSANVTDSSVNIPKPTKFNESQPLRGTLR